MSKSLVILESPGKIKAVQKYLGADYEVLASFGHVFDLPENKLGVNIKKHFEPTFVAKKDKLEIINVIKKMCKKSKAVYLMMDPDREGSGIAHNIYNQIKNLGIPVYRATSNEITQSKIKKAITEASALSQDQTNYNAYLCRRLLDRLAGYKTSFLTKMATGGTSAGRVQSAMLRVIAEREKEILHFVPKEYWVISAVFETDKNSTYPGFLDEKIKVPNQAKAEEIYKAVQKGNPQVTQVEIKEVASKPWAPFTTATMIQSASNFLGWTADKTMKVAQSLYEAGSISYHRTDSPSLSSESISQVRHFISDNFANTYLPKTANIYKAKKGAQEGHECCRPTDLNLPQIATSLDNNRLYEMIWKRTTASQMVPSKDMKTKIVTTVSDYDFISRGTTPLFDGYRKVWTYSKSDTVLLPELTEGQKVKLQDLNKEQKWTKPPNRYSDASLSQKCEILQITRPATFASFLKTLAARKYIKRVKKSFEATDLGMRVTDFLVMSKMCFVDLKFTAKMEQNLDQIAEGHLGHEQVLKEFWEQLKINIESGKKIRYELQKTTYPCPQKGCGGILLRKYSKFGAFYSCENYKKDGGCSYIATIGEDDKPIEKVVKPKEYLDFMCEQCNSKMIKRTSKHGEFAGCSNFPKCRAIADLDGIFQAPKKKSKFKKKKPQ